MSRTLAARPWALLALPLSLTLACTGAKSDGADDTSGSSDDSSTVNTAFAPSVTVVNSLQCAEYQSAGESWDFTLTVDDPQGAATVDDGSVNVLSEDGGTMATYSLACANGMCVGSFRADYDGIGCSLQGSITLEFVVTDENGNNSEPYDYPT